MGRGAQSPLQGAVGSQVGAVSQVPHQEEGWVCVVRRQLAALRLSFHCVVLRIVLPSLTVLSHRAGWPCTHYVTQGNLSPPPSTSPVPGFIITHMRFIFHIQKATPSGIGWHRPVTPVLWRQRQEELRFEGSLGYIARP